MKYFRPAFLFLTITIIFIVCSNLYSQYVEECCADEDLLEYWSERYDVEKSKNKLLEQLNLLNSEIDALKKTSSEKDAEISKSKENLYKAVGTTESGVEEFRKNFNALEKIILGRVGDKEDAEKKFTAMQASKVKCLPEFWDRYQAMKKNLAAWEVKGIANTYTVIKGDCLWKISGMESIYGNPRLWPVLWDANKDGVVSAPAYVPKAIRNPNLIYPGQVLRVPRLSEDEKEKSQNKSSGIRKIRCKQ
ncbi:LysM peptidoglycan-binding domain-containing protein [Bacteroidota bacterium]